MFSKGSLGRAACMAGFVYLLCCPTVDATVFSTVRGVVHDPSHRPISGAAITLLADRSDRPLITRTSSDGRFEVTAVLAGEYSLTVQQEGFAELSTHIEVKSGEAPILHLQLQIATRQDSVTVSETPEGIASDSVTPSVLITRREIEESPGATLTNSLNLITNFVPGAYVTHDQLHIRGGHQVTWAVDGVPIPNTNIASNVGPQIDPKDIDTLEVQRGGYSSEYGDRTYGVFDVIPRTGFERDRELELNGTYGSFQQTNEQVNFGDHTDRFAYFGSLNGNRSNYGLETPGPQIQHDGVWGIGGFASLIYNVNPTNQFRFIFSSRGDDYEIPSSLDMERERDTVGTFTWVHTYSPGVLLTVAPFVHFNRANYDGDPNAQPVSTVQHSDSTYAGAEIALSAVSSTHNARLGFYGFGQRQDEYINLSEFGGSGVQSARQTTGQLEAAFVEDQWKITHWLALTGGVRLTHFAGDLSENSADPRIGASLRIPRLHWLLRGFYGRYYQPPPLSTISGPVVAFAVSQGLGIIPLKGERDEENQFGLTIPLRGWSLDFDSFRLRARNYFDHNSIGDSNVFFPLSIAGARIRGQEVTIHSPRLFHRAEASLAYSYQHAEAQGAVTGGLTDFSPPDEGYFLLDHDQRHTLHANLVSQLPKRTWVAASIYYGSGFTDGEAAYPAHLEPHTTLDLSLGKDIGEGLSLSVNALNVTNRCFLLDNSETFGGTHYADPRQIYLQVRYRFHY
jgi:outer membrane receptor protein involved in Fe transport